MLISKENILLKIFELLPRISLIVEKSDNWPDVKKEILFLLPREMSEVAKDIFTKRKRTEIYKQHKFNDFEKEIIEKYREITDKELNYSIKPKKISNVYSLNDENVIDIKNRIWINENRKDIAKEYNIGLRDLHKIEIGEIFSHIPNPSIEKIILGNKKRRERKKRGRPSRLSIAFRHTIPGRKERAKNNKEALITRNIITAEDVRKIKQRLLQGEKISVLAKEFGVGYKQIHHIKSGRRWAHIEPFEDKVDN